MVCSVLSNVLPAVGHCCVGCDKGHEGMKPSSERLDIILDFEEVESFGLLGESSPVTHMTGLVTLT